MRLRAERSPALPDFAGDEVMLINALGCNYYGYFDLQGDALTARHDKCGIGHAFRGWGWVAVIYSVRLCVRGGGDRLFAGEGVYRGPATPQYW